MVHIWFSGVDWADYFTVLGKYIHAERNGTVWAHEGYLHPHSLKWAIPTPQVGSGRGTGWPYFVKSPLVTHPSVMAIQLQILCMGRWVTLYSTTTSLIVRRKFLLCLIDYLMTPFPHNGRPHNYKLDLYMEISFNKWCTESCAWQDRKPAGLSDVSVL